MYSDVPSTQVWLSQFLPEDKVCAKKLLNEIVYIDTDSIVSSLGFRISKIIENYDTVAIFPVRELTKEKVTQADGQTYTKIESYFDLIDSNQPPILQPSEESLGSEAFISNLITQLSRRYPQKVLSNEGMRILPSINEMRRAKTKALLLVDDLIGSGNRTEKFLNSVYSHPSIKSWISGGFLKIHVVAYMGAANGVELIEKWCQRHKNTFLDVLNKCPMLPQDENIISLCERYADKNEKLPLGFGNRPVRVVFSHSAPNNLPAILFRDRDVLKTKDPALRAKIKSWKALFPKRALPEVLKSDLSGGKQKFPLRTQIKEILRIVNESQQIVPDDIAGSFFGTDDEKLIYIEHCIEIGWLVSDNSKLCITENGRNELECLERRSLSKSVANNTNNYYPAYMSRPSCDAD